MASYPAFAKVSSAVICFSPASSKPIKELISSSISETGMEGKQASNIRSRRLNNVVYIKKKLFMSSFINCFQEKDSKRIKSKVDNNMWLIQWFITKCRTTDESDNFLRTVLQATGNSQATENLVLCKVSPTEEFGTTLTMCNKYYTRFTQCVEIFKSTH